MLAAVALKPLRGGEAMGFRELLYFRVVGYLVEQGVRLTPEQKREIFTVFGQLVTRGAVPLSMDLSTVSRELRYRYQLLQRPQDVVEQLRAGVARAGLRGDSGPHTQAARAPA